MLAGTLKIGGARGLIKHAYRAAAEVHRFELHIDRATKRASLTGAVASSDAYLLQQRPLVFVVPALARSWPVETVTVTGDRVVAALGPHQEKE